MQLYKIPLKKEESWNQHKVKTEDFASMQMLFISATIAMIMSCTIPSICKSAACAYAYLSLRCYLAHTDTCTPKHPLKKTAMWAQTSNFSAKRNNFSSHLLFLCASSVIPFLLLSGLKSHNTHLHKSNFIHSQQSPCEIWEIR